MYTYTHIYILANAGHFFNTNNTIIIRIYMYVHVMINIYEL